MTIVLLYLLIGFILALIASTYFDYEAWKQHRIGGFKLELNAEEFSKYIVKVAFWLCIIFITLWPIAALLAILIVVINIVDTKQKAKSK